MGRGLKAIVISEEQAVESRLGGIDDIIAVFKYLNWLNINER